MIPLPRRSLLIGRLVWPENWHETVEEMDLPEGAGVDLSWGLPLVRRLDLPELSEDEADLLESIGDQPIRPDKSGDQPALPPGIDEEPDLVAIAATLEDASRCWIVLGDDNIVAYVPITGDTEDEADQALRSWADTLTPVGAFGLMAAGSGYLEWEDGDDDDEDDSDVHFLASLPLSGISTHRGRGVDEDEWCEGLADAAAAAALVDFELEIDVMAVVREVYGERLLMCHIIAYNGDPALLETQVRQSLLTALRPLTPRRRVEDRLVVRPEGVVAGDDLFD